LATSATTVDKDRLCAREPLTPAPLGVWFTFLRLAFAFGILDKRLALDGRLRKALARNAWPVEYTLDRANGKVSLQLMQVSTACRNCLMVLSFHIYQRLC
jgi:hypothetical protein